MLANSLPVPKTYACSWEAHQTYKQNGNSVLDQLRAELETLIDIEKEYAVRSSADVEDGIEHSFAGLFTTVLHQRGVDQILQAIEAVWQSADADSLYAYLDRIQNREREIRMAVIIQEMVSPSISGVAFSKNPITSLDEVVVEAVKGSGTLLVQDGVTPIRWVNKWGNWIVRPSQDDIHLELLEQVVQVTRRISKMMKKDVDLEWVYDGRQLYWVQMRDITTMGQENIYSNKMSKEMTPGIVKPLDWSVILPGKAAVWTGMIAELTGRDDIDPESLARLFYFRSYHNVGVFGEIFQSLGMPASRSN